MRRTVRGASHGEHGHWPDETPEAAAAERASIARDGRCAAAASQPGVA